MMQFGKMLICFVCLTPTSFVLDTEKPAKEAESPGQKVVAFTKFIQSYGHIVRAVINQQNRVVIT